MLKNLIIGYNGSKPIFDPENDEGYIEYKLRLDQIPKGKINRLVTQMKFRLNEGKNLIGKYIAIYLLGVDDDGTSCYVTENILDKSINIIKKVVEKCEAEITHIDKMNINGYVISAITIKKYSYDKFIKDFKISFLGSSGYGKTTCISYLTFGIKDNGFGSSRASIFKHIHEHETGITSSIKHDIIGIKNNSNEFIINNYKSSIFLTWDKITEKSDFIISLLDLPGSNKFIRTTLFGLLAHQPDLNIILISMPDIIINNDENYKNKSENYNDNINENKNNNDENCKKKCIKITDEIFKSINLSINLNIPFIVVLSKVDLVNINDFDKIKNLVFDEIKKYISNDELFNKLMLSNPFLISNVTEEGYSKLIQFICKISSIKNYSCGYDNSTKSIDFLINDVYNIKEIGYIVSGQLLKGEIQIDDKLLIGPINNNFHEIVIKSIRKKQIETKILFAGESGSLELKLDSNISIDKHLNILNYKPILTKHIDITLSTQYKFNSGYQYILFIDNLIEPVIFLDYVDNLHVYRFNFVRQQQFYIRKNSKCILKGDCFIFGHT